MDFILILQIQNTLMFRLNERNLIPVERNLLLTQGQIRLQQTGKVLQVRESIQLQSEMSMWMNPRLKQFMWEMMIY